MKLATLTSKTFATSIDFGEGEVLHFSYNPAKFTTRFYQEITHEDGKNNVADLAVFVNALVTEWDLQGEDGVTVPLTVDSLATLPLKFLGQIVEKINEDNNPNKSSSAPSGSFS